MARSTWMVAIFASACVSQVSPSVFTTPTVTVDDVERALAQQSTSAAELDARLGIVRTPWESTGQNRDGTIWAIRYIVTIAPAGAGSRVTVAMDLRTCEPPLGTDRDGRLDASPCARLPDGVTPVMYQEQLDRFAATLRASLGG